MVIEKEEVKYYTEKDLQKLKERLKEKLDDCYDEELFSLIFAERMIDKEFKKVLNENVK